MKSLGKAGKKRPLWYYLVSILLTLLSIGIMYRLVSNNIDELGSIQDTLRIAPLILSFIVFCAGMIFGGLAWGIIMNDLTKPLPLRQHAIIWAVTHAARRIPGSIWYIVGRVAWYDRMGISKTVTTFANVLETLMQLLSGMIVSLLMIPFVTNVETAQIWLLIGGIGLSAIILHPKIIRWILRKFGQDQYIESLSYKRVLIWLLCYFPIWVIGGLILYLTLSALTPLPMSLLPICIGAWSIAGVGGMLIILLPSGLGVAEATLSLLLSTHVSSSIAVTGAILLRVLMTGFEFLFAGIVYIFRKSLGLKEPANPKPAE